MQLFNPFKFILKKLDVSLRTSYLIAFFIICLFFVGSILLQIYFGMSPNMFIFVERFIMLILGLLFLMWTLITHTPLSKLICGWTTTIISLCGLMVSVRHVLLQHYPAVISKVVAPVPGSKFYTVLYLLEKLYYGVPEASEIHWVGFGFSFATWTSVVFFILVLLSLSQIVKKIKG